MHRWPLVLVSVLAGLPLLLLSVFVSLPPALATAADVTIKAYALPKDGGYPHDVAVGADGIVWYTAQRDGKLGRLDPATGKVELTPLGRGAAPHGVVMGPDGAPWVTEGGTNSIVRVDPKTREVKHWYLPEARAYVNLNTLTRMWNAPDGWKRSLEFAQEAAAEGLAVHPMFATNRQGAHFSLDNTFLFDEIPSFRATLTLPAPQREERLRDPAVREQMRRELADPTGRSFVFVWEVLRVERVSNPGHEWWVGRSVTEVARAMAEQRGPSHVIGPRRIGACSHHYSGMGRGPRRPRRIAWASRRRASGWGGATSTAASSSAKAACGAAGERVCLPAGNRISTMVQFSLFNCARRA